MSEEKNVTAPEADVSGGTTRQIFLSLLVVAVCWVFLRFGSLIVSVAITHIWHADNPIVSAYALLFRQLVMMFIYPSVLKIFRPAFIPLYNEIKKQEGDEAAVIFARGVLEIGMLLGLIIFGLLWLFPEATVGFMAPKFDAERQAASVTMMRQMAPGILCLLFAEMYLIFFHAEKKFGIPHSAEAVHKIGWGLGIVAAAKLLGWQGAAVGVTYALACLLQLGVNVVGMHRQFGWVFRTTGLSEWGRKWGKRAGMLVLPLVVGILAARLRDLFTLRLQSHLEAVRFNSVEFARQLTNLPVAFLGQIVSIVMLPFLASILHSEGKEAHRRTVESTVETLWVLSIPIVAAVLVLAPELMSLLFVQAHWGPAEFALCAQGALAARMIALGFTFMVLENILLPGLFSIQSMWWPILWGLAASAFQILCLVGLANAGLPPDSAILLAGVAFVYPLSRVFKNGILLLVLRRKTGLFPGKRFYVFVAKMVAMLVATVALTYLAHRVCEKVLGGIRVDADTMVYKLTLVAQLAVPSIIMFAGFAGLVLAAGYKPQLVTLAQTLLKRKAKAKPQPGAAPAPAESAPTDADE